jgi:hypothetical protein
MINFWDLATNLMNHEFQTKNKVQNCNTWHYIKGIYVNIPIEKTLNMAKRLLQMLNINAEIRREYKILEHKL